MLKYFRAEEEPKARLPSNFINGFLEVKPPCDTSARMCGVLTRMCRAATEDAGEEKATKKRVYKADRTIPFPFLSFLLKRRYAVMS